MVSGESCFSSARVVSQVKVLGTVPNDAAFDCFVVCLGLALLIVEMAVDNASEGSDMVDSGLIPCPGLVRYGFSSGGGQPVLNIDDCL
jgi:hypothetical protein